MELLIGLCLGVGLSAACGFRVFVPVFFVGLAHHSGHIELAEGFTWVGSPAALWCFGSAMVLEVLAYYIPWLDNLLDTVATPAAVIAGTILTMGMVGELSPFLQWTLGIVVGGGTAAAVQAGTVTLRGTSSATTGGIANPAIASGEVAASGGFVALATFLPILGGILALFLVAGIGMLALKMFRRPKKADPVQNPAVG